MRDMKLVDGNKKGYTIDIDIINGYPVLLKEASMTSDQRAAVAGLLQLGSIPGAENLGIDWASIYSGTQDVDIIALDNQVKQLVNQLAVSEDDENSSIGQYFPILYAVNNRLELRILNSAKEAQQ